MYTFVSLWMLQPLSTNSFTISTWPHLLAMCNGVMWFWNNITNNIFAIWQAMLASQTPDRSSKPQMWVFWTVNRSRKPVYIDPTRAYRRQESTSRTEDWRRWTDDIKDWTKKTVAECIWLAQERYVWRESWYHCNVCDRRSSDKKFSKMQD